MMDWGAGRRALRLHVGVDTSQGCVSQERLEVNESKRLGLPGIQTR
jgi:hypothetical protein